MIKNQKQKTEKLTTSLIEGDLWKDAVQALHAQIHSELPDEKKHSFLHRSADYFAPLLDPCVTDRALVGAFDEHGALVGMCAVYLHADLFAAKNAKAMTCSKDIEHIVGQQERFATLQSLSLTNAAKGKGLGQSLIRAIIDWAMASGVQSVLAQVAHDNPCSWVQLMKQGFDMAASWHAEHGRYLLHYNVNATDKKSIQTCIAAKEEFYVGAAAHDDWISLFEDHLAKKGRVMYHEAEKQSKLLRFDLV